ncbi:MAG: AarF/UbiB family protein [Methanomicrobiales archaeon]|nr:AarF/UbiB family protein [Methanomicrobiales archaeon]
MERYTGMKPGSPAPLTEGEKTVPLFIQEGIAHLRGDAALHRLRRYSQIADVFIKYGFGIVLEGFLPGLPRLPRIPIRRRFEEESPYVRIRMMIEELGPTFVKFGQIMSTRTELLPPPLIEELKKLTDEVKPLPFQEILPLLKRELEDPGRIFSRIEEMPVAAASLAQVHRATLLDGTQVVLKVQRPGIEEVIETDITILESLARHLESRYPHMRVYNPTGMVREFAVQIAKELDFIRDGKNAEILASNLKNISKIKIPRIFWEYSRRKLLVMEYIEGVRIDDLDGIRVLGLDPKSIAEILLSAYLQQIFRDGFFHGDPHPGNILVTREGRVALLDFGIVGVLRPEKREVFIQLLYGIVENDVDTIVEAYQLLGIRINDEDIDGLKDDTYGVLRDYEGYEVSQVDFREVMVRIPEILRKYHLQVPLSMMLMIKVILMMISISTKIDPTFNFPSRVQPYLEEIMQHHFISAERWRRDADSALSSLESLVELPKSLNRTFQKISEGRLRLEIADLDMQELTHTIKYASKIMLLGLTVSSLVIGASIVVMATQPSLSSTQCSGIMRATLIGYLFAVGLAIYAIYWVVVKRRPER